MHFCDGLCELRIDWNKSSEASGGFRRLLAYSANNCVFFITGAWPEDQARVPGPKIRQVGLIRAYLGTRRVIVCPGEDWKRVSDCGTKSEGVGSWRLVGGYGEERNHRGRGDRGEGALQLGRHRPTFFSDHATQA